MAGWDTTLAVIVPELTVAPAAALGAVYCATQYAPDQMKWLQNIISDHIVQPHLQWFESRAGSLKRARDKYNDAKRKERISNGDPIGYIAIEPNTPKEKSDVIAGVLVAGSVAMAADFVATYFGQRFASKHIWKKANISKTIAIAESVVHLGGIVTMAGPAAILGENMHYTLAKTLHKKLGMKKETADDVGIAYPYVVFPGQIASLASVLLAHGMNGKGTPHR